MDTVGKTVYELELGEKDSFSKTISESDVYLFAGITGDLNPMHVNREYVAKTFFKKPIAHGPLITGLVAPVLGMKLPGLGTVLVELQTRYLAPVYFGDTVSVKIELVAKDEKKNRANFDCQWVNQAGKVIADGKAIVSPPVRKK